LLFRTAVLTTLLTLSLTPLWTAGPPPGSPRALAILDRQVVVGTDRGLYRVGPTGYEPLFTRSGVRDLAAGGGKLVAATEVGLYEWDARDPMPRARDVGAGAEVHSVAVAPQGTVWVATEVGLFVREDAGPFRRVSEIPATRARAVRLAGEEVWLATPGTLWVRRPGEPFRPVRRGLSEGWWEVVGAVDDGSATFVAVPRGLWRVDRTRLDRLAAGVQPVHAICRSAGALWLAAREGIFVMEGGTPRLQRSLNSVSSVEAFDLESGDGRVWVAARQGILSFEPRASARVHSGPAPYRAPLPASGGMAAVHRAVLAYLGISPARLREADRRARRAWMWPELHAGFSLDRDRGHQSDRDEAVSSGALWRLRDAERDRATDLRFELELSWELDRIVSPDDTLAVSRERREIVELVERVLDRVNQTYFERERVLQKLERSAEGDDPEALTLRLRELTAALDGWTGGAFTRLLEGSPPRLGRSP
jgi:hypothetical protein